MFSEGYKKRIEISLNELKVTNQVELNLLLTEFCEIIVHEKSETLDKEALYKQVLILSEQAQLPKEKRNDLLVTGALFYISIFAVVPNIGTFLKVNKARLEGLLKEPMVV